MSLVLLPKQEDHLEWQSAAVAETVKFLRVERWNYCAHGAEAAEKFPDVPVLNPLEYFSLAVRYLDSDLQEPDPEPHKGMGRGSSWLLPPPLELPVPSGIAGQVRQATSSAG